MFFDFSIEKTGVELKTAVFGCSQTISELRPGVWTPVNVAYCTEIDGSGSTRSPVAGRGPRNSCLGARKPLFWRPSALGELKTGPRRRSRTAGRDIDFSSRIFLYSTLHRRVTKPRVAPRNSVLELKNRLRHPENGSDTENDHFSLCGGEKVIVLAQGRDFCRGRGKISCFFNILAQAEQNLAVFSTFWLRPGIFPRVGQGKCCL